MADSQFGAMVGAHNVDEAVRKTLARWIQTYLQEVARLSGEDPDELHPFRSWRISASLDPMPEDQTPTCIIWNQGITEPPLKRGGSTRPGKPYQGIWRFRIGVHATARGKKNKAAPRAVTLAKMYCLAVRSILIQKRDEEDASEALIGFVDWIDENYDGMDSEADRTTSMSYCEFNVTVFEASTWGTGPMVSVPELDPGELESPVWPTVIEANFDIVKTPIGDPFPELMTGPTLAFDSAFSEEFDVAT